MNFEEEIECLEITAGIISRSDNRIDYTFNDWVLAEKILEEVGFQ